MCKESLADDLSEILNMIKRSENKINKMGAKFYITYFTMMMTIYTIWGLFANGKHVSANNKTKVNPSYIYFGRERRRNEYRSEHKRMFDEEWSKPSPNDRSLNFSLDRRQYEISQAVDQFRHYQGIDRPMAETNFYQVR